MDEGPMIFVSCSLVGTIELYRVTINLIHNQSPPELSTSNIGFKKSYTVCLYLELIKNRNFQHLQRYLYKVDNILVLW